MVIQGFVVGFEGFVCVGFWLGVEGFSGWDVGFVEGGGGGV